MSGFILARADSTCCSPVTFPLHAEIQGAIPCSHHRHNGGDLFAAGPVSQGQLSPSCFLSAEGESLRERILCEGQVETHLGETSIWKSLLERGGEGSREGIAASEEQCRLQELPSISRGVSSRKHN